MQHTTQHFKFKPILLCIHVTDLPTPIMLRRVVAYPKMCSLRFKCVVLTHGPCLTKNVRTRGIFYFYT